MHPACFCNPASAQSISVRPRALAYHMAHVFVLTCLAGHGLLLGSIALASEPVDFDRTVRPILSENCFSCHGPDAAERQADLRLDVRDAAVAAGAIDLEHLADSSLLARIVSTDPELMMPPPKSNKQLTATQKELLGRWIEEGAKYTQHWSFAPPLRPEGIAGPRAIDTLVDRLIEREGLERSPVADPVTLARRLTLDLIGLPPTQAQVELISGDPSAAGRGRLIDELLASPHYGERMAISWLDAVRFADTIGYHSDTPRNVYPYRDYVIAAFNSNKPFDQFTIEQVAGDLLPGATQEQKVASCFNRLLLTTEEGGAQAKDYEARYLGDRVRAIGTAWLGLTIGCSQCHDHKFDPITARDFYSLGAFFADIDEAIIGSREAGMMVLDAQQSTRVKTLQASIADLQSQLAAEIPELAPQRAAWEQQQLALHEASKHWRTLEPKDVSVTAGSTIAVDGEQRVLLSGLKPEKENYQLAIPLVLDVTEPAGQVRALRLEAIPHDSLPGKGSGRAGNGNFVLTEVSAQIQHSDGTLEPLAFAAARASIEQKTGAEKHPHYVWSAASVIDKDKDGAEWGWAILPESTQAQQLQLQLAQPYATQPGDTLRIEMQNQHGQGSHSVGHFRWSLSTDPLAFQSPLSDVEFNAQVVALQTPLPERKPEQITKLRTAFHNAVAELEPVRTQLASLTKELADFEAALPRCLISKSLPTPRVVRILPRGNWLDESGPTVAAQLPGFLTATTSASDSQKLTRLDLAQWLISRDNPLTARVFVNRLWKQFFGLGLSKNLDDLGAQGEPPVNGPLLDYLSVEFMESGWDVKHMVRLIVSSQAYQRSSNASPEMFQRDPENRFCARQSRFRLPAELVRDNALAIGGILSPHIGGPSVKPYQPEGYWENLNFPQRTYTADPAPLQHRRGLYVWWQRSFVHPSLLAFDAPTREECAADRSQSNIPQQALVLLNDPTYLEAARSLAQKKIIGGEGEINDRIANAFRTATARSPSAAELNLLTALYTQSLKAYAADEEATQKFLKLGREGVDLKESQPPQQAVQQPAEQAAAIQVARAVLNLHEVITRY